MDMAKDLIYGLEDRPSAGALAVTGLQHMLAMFASIVAMPLVLAGSVGAGPETTARMVSASLLVSGLSTLIQVHRIGWVGSGLLSVQGTSSAFIGVMAAMGAEVLGGGGTPEEALGLMMGVGGVCALADVAMGFFLPLVRKVLTPLVSGTVIVLLGVNLMGIAMKKVSAGAAGAGWNWLLALVSIGAVLALYRMKSTWCRMVAVLGGIVAGTAVAAAFGQVSLAEGTGAWAVLPKVAPFPLALSWKWMLPMLILYVSSTVETVGDITVTSLISGEPTEGPLYERRLRGGILADGLNSMLGCALGSFPTTSFSQNNGVIQLTGVASRRVGVLVGVLLMAMGMLAGVSRVVMSVPGAVMGGVCLVMFSLVAMSGIRMLGTELKGSRDLVVVATGLGMGIGVMVCPEALAGLPEHVRDLFGSGVVTGTVAVVVAQLIAGRGGDGRGTAG